MIRTVCERGRTACEFISSSSRSATRDRETRTQSLSENSSFPRRRESRQRWSWGHAWTVSRSSLDSRFRGNDEFSGMTLSHAPSSKLPACSSGDSETQFTW